MRSDLARTVGARGGNALPACPGEMLRLGDA